MEMNRQFLALGEIYPRGWPDRPSQLLAECLIEGTDPSIEIVVQFDQAIERQVLNAAGEPAEELAVTGHRHSAGSETMEKQVRLPSLPNRIATLRTAGSEQMELIESGHVAGTIVWWWEPLHGTVEGWTEQIRSGLHRVRVAVANRLEWDREAPEQSLMRTLRATQVVMQSPDAAFLALTSQPRRPYAVAAVGSAA